MSVVRQAVRHNSFLHGRGARVALGVVLGAGSASPALALDFEILKGAGLLTLEGTDPVLAGMVYDSFATAAGVWSSLLIDPVTVKVTVDWGGTSGLASTSGAFVTTGGGEFGLPFPLVKTAMMLDATSSYDATSVAHLQPGPILKHRTNSVVDFMFPEFEAHYDADGSVNNAFIFVPTTQAKALGIPIFESLAAPDVAPGTDGTIKFSSTNTWDFSPATIDDDADDFVGAAVHEIGHLLGFGSGVDIVTAMLPAPFGGGLPPAASSEDDVFYAGVLDFFRYSAASLMITADTGDAFVPDISFPLPAFLDPFTMRFFSIDGGSTSLATFATGTEIGGDGDQAGHWKADELSGLFQGIFDPTLDEEFELFNSFMALVDAGLLSGDWAADLIAMDVIGWNVIPAPGSTALGLAGLALMAGRRRR